MEWTREPGVAARVVEEHQRLEAVLLRLVRHQLGERYPQPQRFRGEIDAAAVAFVVDQVGVVLGKIIGVRESSEWPSGQGDWLPTQDGSLIRTCAIIEVRLVEVADEPFVAS